jgi:hypothetical protein
MPYNSIMDLQAWISTFTKLHEKAKRNALSGEDLKTYNTGRDELARAMVAAQGQTLKEGENPRKILRVARAVQIDLDLSTGRVRALTMELAREWFSALIEKAPPPTEAVGFTLRLPGGLDMVVGRCKLMDITKRTGSVCARFAFKDMSERDLERVEGLVFDSVVQQLRRI